MLTLQTGIRLGITHSRSNVLTLIFSLSQIDRQLTHNNEICRAHTIGYF